ncbi:hypothetical protein [Nocardia altamirensis]|uniref:hypothetical protein n=1 Tax=Nocardia altamirensis TaxID=472158 RepID=UPI00114C8B79|nr:hypothetical protein [Nocardia altamirensis]
MPQFPVRTPCDTAEVVAEPARPKDRADLERIWPALDNAQRTAVLECVARLHPGHARLPFM